MQSSMWCVFCVCVCECVKYAYPLRYVHFRAFSSSGYQNRIRQRYHLLWNRVIQRPNTCTFQHTYTHVHQHCSPREWELEVRQVKVCRLDTNKVSNKMKIVAFNELDHQCWDVGRCHNIGSNIGHGTHLFNIWIEFIWG